MRERNPVLTAEYVAARQQSLIDKIAEDDANFGRLVLWGIMEQARQSLQATGPANSVDVQIEATVVPVSEESQNCTETVINLGIVKITKKVHKIRKDGAQTSGA
ncbi:MAG TPA: hypothetical protein VF006_23395 [Longimicrobium sp.]